MLPAVYNNMIIIGPIRELLLQSVNTKYRFQMRLKEMKEFGRRQPNNNNNNTYNDGNINTI